MLPHDPRNRSRRSHLRLLPPPLLPTQAMPAVAQIPKPDITFSPVVAPPEPVAPPLMEREDSASPDHVTPDFSVLRRRVPIKGRPHGHYYAFQVIAPVLRTHQRIVWGPKRQHRIGVFVGKGGGVLLKSRTHSHKFRTKREAALHLSKVMMRESAPGRGGFHTDIPFRLVGGGALHGEDLGGDLGARDSFGRYKEYELPGDLVVREYRKDELRIMRVGITPFADGKPVPKGTAQHARIMALIAAEKAETKSEKREARQERRKRAGGIAASLVEAAAAGAVKGYKAKSKKGKTPAAEIEEDVDTGPVEEAPASSGMPGWLLPVGIVAGLGLVVAVAMSSRGGGE